MSGKNTVAARMSDSTTSTPTITEATAFNHGLLTCGPSTARSLHSSTRNTVALGRRMPASACTARVSSPSGAFGMSTIPAATTTSPA